MKNSFKEMLEENEGKYQKEHVEVTDKVWHVLDVFRHFGDIIDVYMVKVSNVIVEMLKGKKRQ